MDTSSRCADAGDILVTGVFSAFSPRGLFNIPTFHSAFHAAYRRQSGIVACS